jgi:hypothetical protein
VRCVAVDWSGRQRGDAEFIWIAEAVDGRLTFLENGRSRCEVVAWLIARRPEVVGIDFAFSFASWYCRERHWSTGPEVWSGVSGEGGERLLREERDPFWGRTTRRPADDPSRPQLRETERRLSTKSAFQIGGAGAVGTGSIRGMPHLLELRAHGFTIWPFDGHAAAPLAVEIYPRALYPQSPGQPRPVKSSGPSRRRHLAGWFAGEPLLTRAAGSEDAFDAAVSALVMSEHGNALAALPARPDRALEGEIWIPATGS